MLEPGKKTVNVSEDEEVVPSTKTDGVQPDQTKPKTIDAHKINDVVKTKPSDKNPKSETEQPHLNGDDAKPAGVNKSGIEVPKIIENPVDTPNDKEDTIASDTEEDKNEMPKPRIQDRKGSIRELVPDKRHGFQLNLKVVAFLFSELYTAHC